MSAKNRITGAGTTADPAWITLDGVARPFIVSVGAMMAFEMKAKVSYEQYWQKTMAKVFVRNNDNGELLLDDDGSYAVNPEGLSWIEVYTLVYPFFEYAAQRCKVPLPEEFDLYMLGDWIQNDPEVLQGLNAIISNHLAPKTRTDDEKNAPSPARPKTMPGQSRTKSTTQKKH